MSLKEIFRKQGGFNLIRNYLSSGVLNTALCEFLILGKTRTALEILRLSTEMKVKQKLAKIYEKKIPDYEKRYDASIPQKKSKIIWICWFQGIENAPEIVKACYNSIKHNLSEYEIILLTNENLDNYISFPNEIQEKINKKIIKGAHLSDLIRLEVLLKYGGTWVDATVFCSDSNIPNYMLDSDLFMFQSLKPGRDGKASIISNWFITAKSNNHLLFLTRCMLYDYWEKNNKVIDYFIFHYFFQICIDNNIDEWNKVIPYSNSTPHILLLNLFEKYDEKIWSAVCRQSPFHKLTYKFDFDKSKLENTNYKKIIQCGGI